MYPEPPAFFRLVWHQNAHHPSIGANSSKRRNRRRVPGDRLPRAAAITSEELCDQLPRLSFQPRLSVSTYATNHHDVTLVQLSFDFYMIEAKPENLIGDRAYDSAPLDEQLRQEGIEMLAPHKSNRKKRKSQTGRRPRRYERRWIVERFFAWLQWQRRLVVRWEYYSANFLGFIQLASIVILLKRF